MHALYCKLVLINTLLGLKTDQNISLSYEYLPISSLTNYKIVLL